MKKRGRMTIFLQKMPGSQKGIVWMAPTMLREWLESLSQLNSHNLYMTLKFVLQFPFLSFSLGIYGLLLMRHLPFPLSNLTPHPERLKGLIF